FNLRPPSQSNAHEIDPPVIPGGSKSRSPTRHGSERRGRPHVDVAAGLKSVMVERRVIRAQGCDCGPCRGQQAEVSAAPTGRQPTATISVCAFLIRDAPYQHLRGRNRDIASWGGKSVDRYRHRRGAFLAVSPGSQTSQRASRPLRAKEECLSDDGYHSCRCSRGADDAQRKDGHLETMGRQRAKVDELLHVPVGPTLANAVGLPE